MIVVKVGGAVGVNYDLVLQDLVRYKDVVLVHGGSSELNEISKKLGKPPKMVTSVSGFVSRRTDRETLEIFNMVYCGKMNKMIVEKLQKLGVNAIGLSGIDGQLLKGRRKHIVIVEDGKKRVIRDDYTGKVEEVNVNLLNLLLKNGYLPVISPPALSYDKEAVNVDGDRASAVIAGALNADVLIILSNTSGLLREVKNEGSVIREITMDGYDDAMGFAHGMMKKKVMGAFEALENGVSQVVFGDARVEDPVTRALHGEGTVIH